MKKILTAIAVVLALLMALPLASYAAEKSELPFSDVKAGKWYYGDVKRVYESGLMAGVTDRSFDPNGALTRGMCATILYRAVGEPDVASRSLFADVKDGKYYSEAVAWAKENGVVNGKTATTFDPSGNITREEFATMLYRFLDAEDLALPITREGTLSDADSVSKFAAEAVDAMYRGEVVNGRENGEFDPDADITRAEAAAMIGRFFDNAKSILRVEESGDVRVTFVVPDAEGGIFEGKTIDEVNIGYIPEGLNLYSVDEIAGTGDDYPYIRHYRISTEFEIQSILQPFAAIYVSTSNAFEWGWSEHTFDMVYFTTLNGMDAYVIEKPTFFEGNEIDITVITFGDNDVTVNVLGMGLSSEEVFRIAESITATSAD